MEEGAEGLHLTREATAGGDTAAEVAVVVVVAVVEVVVGVTEGAAVFGCWLMAYLPLLAGKISR